ncbi:hypothetical protein BH09PLA1_BH09PLA1_20380 [soil metagenome]
MLIRRGAQHILRRAVACSLHELLESRRMLSSSLDGAGLLSVTGTGANDDILITLSGGTLQVFESGSLASSFANALVKSIRIDVLAGDDIARISDRVVQPATLLGGDGNDRLRGGGGNDSLDGGAGNDLLDGGKRGDQIFGGEGKDTVDYRARTVAVNVTLDDAGNDGAGEGDNVHSDVETIFGGSAGDTLRGNGRSNRINGYDGDDTIIGSAGNDSIDGGAGNDSISGNAGDDSMLGGEGDDQFIADAGADGADLVDGGPGNDLVSYAARTTPVRAILGERIDVSGSEDRLLGVESLLGGAGDDQLTALGASGVTQMVDGGPGNDSLDAGIGLEGPAVFHGGDGNDGLFVIGPATLFGDAGDDDLIGGKAGSGQVLMDGGPGDDRLSPLAEGAFDFRGGDGDDALDMSGQGQYGSISVSKDDIANDNAGGPFFEDDPPNDDNVRSDIELIVGTDGPDTIIGSEANDIIDGGGGGDQMFGLGGNDTFLNATLPDTPDAQNGPSDLCDGGAGIDALQDDGDPGPGTEIKFAVQSVNSVSTRARHRSRTRAADPPPSATLTTSGGKKGELTIVGTSGADSIGIVQTKALTTVFINALAPMEFDSSQVKKVVVFAGAGNDLVNLRSSKGTKPVTKTAFIYGEDGDDTLLGGDGTALANGDISGGNLISGGNGNDSIRGGNGRDYIDGGDQNKSIQADGTDTLDGGAGNDVVTYYQRTTAITINLGTGLNAGGAGENDRLLNIEDIYSGLGNDSLIGSDGGNLIDGGNGKDTIRANGGVDRIKAGRGADSVFTLGDNAIDIVDLIDVTRDTIHADPNDKVSLDTETGIVDQRLAT